MGRRGSTLLFSLCGANGPRAGTGRQAVFARWAHVPLSAVAGLSSLRARWGATASRVIPIHGQYIRSLPACQGFRKAERSAGCRSTILDRRKKEMKEMKDGDASGIAGVADNHCMKRVTAAWRAPLQRPFTLNIKFVQNYEKTLAFRFRLCQNTLTLSKTNLQ